MTPRLLLVLKYLHLLTSAAGDDDFLLRLVVVGGFVPPSPQPSVRLHQLPQKTDVTNRQAKCVHLSKQATHDGEFLRFLYQFLTLKQVTHNGQFLRFLCQFLTILRINVLNNVYFLEFSLISIQIYEVYIEVFLLNINNFFEKFLNTVLLHDLLYTHTEKSF